jgi:CO/xanthine dehydrogenase Mo-binding subunit
VYNLRAELARWFDLPPEAVQVEHVEGAGCYGHNAADDAAGDAALLAQAVPGRHVQVMWSRQDELSWAPFGPAMAIEVAVELNDREEINHWRQEIWSNGHSSRPSSQGNPPLLAALDQGKQPVPSSDPPLTGGGGSARNAIPGYRLPGLTVVSHVLQEMPLRTSALRALGAHLNVYATESMIDELAERAAKDPIEYRLSLLADPRARKVLERVAEAVNWNASRPSAQNGAASAHEIQTTEHEINAGPAGKDRVSADRATAAGIDAGRFGPAGSNGSNRAGSNPDGPSQSIRAGRQETTPTRGDWGRGVGYARYKNTGAYCAVVADVEATDSVRVVRLTIAVDVGQVVNPDGVRNQIEGGAIQAVSWTTREQVRFDRHGVTSRNWEDYPILTFADVPSVVVELVDRPDCPSLGAGEASIGPTAAAIGNAVRAALGVRVGTLPLTPDNVIAALP